ncbi:NADH-quinone oxidoreductase subunit NuoN [Flaviflexus equikiangi]|uniref:NADH-quinone oxidoreductase subunit N n=1 Tax=Flaviflexus equikiangi TaxID=2758573 RepID=A0ABS2TFW3_9ACTO|nr:NADH-quinone oxidoreductase subunit NuoN [Flaviflexus equikiangi]MBM9433527.1 NADH-quinone oxidoreductase subunit NuoN [Flaviflexus equikiangi]
MTNFVTPVVDWAALAPTLIVMGAAVLGVLIEAFAPRTARRGIQVTLTLLALAGALVAVVWRWTEVEANGAQTIVGGQLIEDPFTIAAQGIVLISAILAAFVIADRTQTREGAFAASAAARPGSPEERELTRAGVEQTEVYPLVLFAVTGMMVFPAAGDLLTLFIALEVLSLPLYVLSGLSRRRRLISQEAALKYFLLGAFSSAFFLMGIALLYGFSGSIRYSEVASATSVTVGMDWMLIVGIVLVLIGLLFKVGAVPFHSWTPDVYQGAPTPITGFMAAGTKVAAFAAMIRFLYIIGGGMKADLQIMLWAIIIATMLLGTVLGLVQTDIKRMLAYSSVAHAGFVLIAVTSYGSTGISSTLFYLLAYSVATVGAFGVVTLVREKDSAGNITGEATSLSSWAGLAKRKPILAVAMLIFLLSFAGIPLTGGFEGKFTAFAAGIAGGAWPLVLIAVIASAATAFFYFRLILLMFFTEPDEGTTVVASEGMSLVAIVLCAVATIALGVVPGPVLQFLSEAAVLLP